jgi:hypothetical protein
MSNKYSRHQSVISRQSDQPDSEDHWLKQFEKSLQKGAVQSKSVDSSLFDQINSVMNGKSKFPSVAAAVEDMRERSGLTAYLDKVSKNTESDSKKVASNQGKKKRVVNLFEKCPQIRNTFKNFIDGNKGNSVVPAIIDRVRSIHQNDVSDAKDWDDDNLIREVSEMNLLAKQNNPTGDTNFSNLGVRDTDSAPDPANSDFFNSLMPASKN